MSYVRSIRFYKGEKDPYHRTDHYEKLHSCGRLNIYRLPHQELQLYCNSQHNIHHSFWRIHFFLKSELKHWNKQFYIEIKFILCIRRQSIFTHHLISRTYHYKLPKWDVYSILNFVNVLLFCIENHWLNRFWYTFHTMRYCVRTECYTFDLNFDDQLSYLSQQLFCKLGLEFEKGCLRY